MTQINKPQEIDSHNWYYEKKGGVELIHEVYSDETYLSTAHIKIPWKMLRASLARHDHKKKPRGQMNLDQRGKDEDRRN